MRGKVYDYAASGCQWRVQSATPRVQSTRQSNTHRRRSQPKHSWWDVPDTAVHAVAWLRGTREAAS